MRSSASDQALSAPDEAGGGAACGASECCGNRIAVYLRIRPPPPASDGQERPADLVLEVDADETHVTFVPPDGRSAAAARDYDYEERAEGGGAGAAGVAASFYGPFAFRRVFVESATQQDVYETCARPLVERALAGFNATLFAYGQTASGKTYTMTGDYGGGESGECGLPERPCRGVVPRALEDVVAFAQARNAEGAVEVTVAVSYLEIYKQAVADLLADEQPEKEKPPVVYLFGKPTLLRSARGHRSSSSASLEPADFASGTADQSAAAEEPPAAAPATARGRSRLRLQTAEDGHLRVLGLVHREVATAEEGVEALRVGDSHRTTAATSANEVSSRSHTIFTVFVRVLDKARGTVRVSKINFVDLAGSERTSAVCDVASKRFKESTSINTGLHYLEQIIVSLQSGASYIPYRNSKLTHILQDSLGGRTHTAMIATITPLVATMPESLSTCHFSQRVACITNSAVLHRETILNPLGEIRRLRREVAALQRQLLLAQGSVSSAGTPHLPHSAKGDSGAAAAAPAPAATQRQLPPETVRDLRVLVRRYLDSEKSTLDVFDADECQACFALMRSFYREALGAATSRAAGPQPPPQRKQQQQQRGLQARGAPVVRARSTSVEDASVLRRALAAAAEQANEAHAGVAQCRLVLRRRVLHRHLHNAPTQPLVQQQQQQQEEEELRRACDTYRQALARVEQCKAALFCAAAAGLGEREHSELRAAMAAHAEQAAALWDKAVLQQRQLRAAVVRARCLPGGSSSSSSSSSSSGIQSRGGDAVRVEAEKLRALWQKYCGCVQEARCARDSFLSGLFGQPRQQQRPGGNGAR